MTSCYNQKHVVRSHFQNIYTTFLEASPRREGIGRYSSQATNFGSHVGLRTCRLWQLLNLPSFSSAASIEQHLRYAIFLPLCSWPLPGASIRNFPRTLYTTASILRRHHRSYGFGGDTASLKTTYYGTLNTLWVALADLLSSRLRNPTN